MKKVQGVAAAVLAASILLASPVWAAENPASVIQATGGGAGVRTVAPQGIMEAQEPVLTQAQKLALEKNLPGHTGIERIVRAACN